MKKEVFDKATAILRQINKINQAMGAFEREEKDLDGNVIDVVDLEPKLFVEHLSEAYDGRVKVELPLILNLDLLNLLKSRLLEEKAKLEKEFESL